MYVSFLILPKMIGKDLIVLESDSPILVQVKRRKNPDHVELIKGVREFVGTLYIENERKGIYNNC